MIEILQPQNRAEWLELRRQTVGGSEAAALLDAHPWLTRAELWARKSGLVDDEHETPAMRRGRLLESVAVDFLREECPSWAVTANIIGLAGKFYRDIDLGLSCTPDAFVADLERDGFGICQLKSVAPMTFKESWLDTSREILVTPPIYAIVQAILEAYMTGASWACVAALVVDHGISLHIVDVPLHAALLDRLRDEAKNFWRSVRTGAPPEFNYERDGAVIGRLYAGETGKIIDLSGINDLPELVAEDQTLKASIKIDGARREAIKNRFRAELQEAGAATFNGRIIATRKIIRKKGFAVAPSEYTQITLKPEKELSSS